MKRMNDGSVHMELSASTKAKGWTMRANINPELIPALKRWNQDSAAIIRRAIRQKDCKAAIAELENAKARNRQIREISEHHDKIVYNANGEPIYIWDYKKKAMYELIKE